MHDLENSAESDSDAGASGILPHPFLLFLRSLNAWFNFLHSSGKWPAWNEFLKEAAAATVGKTTRKLSSNDPLVILPSCRDMEMDSCTCLRCKAADLMENPQLYPAMPDEVWQAAAAMLDPAAGPISDEEALHIAQARRADDPAVDAWDPPAPSWDVKEAAGDADTLSSTRTTLPELPRCDQRSD